MIWHPNCATKLITALLVFVHCILLGHCAVIHSPVLDETAHLPVGLAIWRFGRVDLYPNNPPLVKCSATAPLLIAGPKTDWRRIDHPALNRPEFSLGADFIKANGKRSFWFFTIARWACIPFSLIGAVTCFYWSRSLYGQRSGVLALALWCFSPTVLANAHLITPDIAATSLGLLACMSFWRWLIHPTWYQSIICGITLGLANLCKFTWLFLFPLWLVYGLLFLVIAGSNSSSREIEMAARSRRITIAKHLFMIVATGLLIINAGYGFRGSFTRLGDYEFFSRTLSGSEYHLGIQATIGSNRFSRTVVANLPIPLPKDYLRGIDLQKRDFEQEFVGYLGGRRKKGGWWYYYLYGLSVKTPLGSMALLAMVVLHTLFCIGGHERSTVPTRWPAECWLLIPSVMVLFLVSWQTGINMFIRYALPALPFLFIWVSKLASPQCWNHSWTRRCVLVCAFATAASSLSCYPHMGSYFNQLVGGPIGGVDHLIDANIGWGQDLLFLKRWYDRHPEARPLGLVYFGNMDARMAGLDFHLPNRGPKSPNHRCQQSEDAQGPSPGWYAIDASFTRGMSRLILDGDGDPSSPQPNCDFSYFKYFEPVDYAGYSIYIYHISESEANRVRRRLGLRPLSDSASGQEEHPAKNNNQETGDG